MGFSEIMGTAIEAIQTSVREGLTARQNSHQQVQI